jgi:hypothetical protein
MKTKRTECTFVVKETVEGKPSVVAEPSTHAGLVGFELAEGTSLDTAREIAKYLRQHVRAISHTFMQEGRRPK